MNCDILNKKVNIVNLILSVSFLTISSKVIIPLYPVPITLQMFAIYFLGIIQSPRESFYAILSWLFIGTLGFPVFASSFGGLSGPTSGYLIGMLFGAPIMGYLRAKQKGLITSSLACYSVVHFFGYLWLVNFVGWTNAFYCGILPFIIPEFFKISIVCAIFSHNEKQ